MADVIYEPVMSASTPRGSDKRTIHLAVPEPEFGHIPMTTTCGQRPVAGLRRATRKEVLERSECGRCWRIMRRDHRASVYVPFDGTA